MAMRNLETTKWKLAAATLVKPSFKRADLEHRTGSFRYTYVSSNPELRSISGPTGGTEGPRTRASHTSEDLDPLPKPSATVHRSGDWLGI